MLDDETLFISLVFPSNQNYFLTKSNVHSFWFPFLHFLNFHTLFRLYLHFTFFCRFLCTLAYSSATAFTVSFVPLPFSPHFSCSTTFHVFPQGFCLFSRLFNPSCDISDDNDRKETRSRAPCIIRCTFTSFISLKLLAAFSPIYLTSSCFIAVLFQFFLYLVLYFEFSFLKFSVVHFVKHIFQLALEWSRCTLFIAFVVTQSYSIYEAIAWGFWCTFCNVSWLFYLLTLSFFVFPFVVFPIAEFVFLHFCTIRFDFWNAFSLFYLAPLLDLFVGTSVLLSNIS